VLSVSLTFLPEKKKEPPQLSNERVKNKRLNRMIMRTEMEASGNDLKKEVN
jgi:hypothetical protein